MKVNRYEIAAAVIVLAFFAIAAYFYPQVPERIASHWNAAGQVDGYTSRFWGMFLLPIMAVGLTVLLFFLPHLDPLRANVERFKGYYYSFIIVFLVFFVYIYLLTIFWNLGFRFDIGQLMIPAMSVLFYYVGVLVGKAQRNYFIGIRTPWTLSSDRVWNRTHVVGGRIFKIAAVVSLLGLLFPRYSFIFILVPIIVAAVFSVVYSYFVYRREVKA